MTKQKVHSLTGRITPKLMLAAFKAVKRNRGAAGWVRGLHVDIRRDDCVAGILQEAGRKRSGSA